MNRTKFPFLDQAGAMIRDEAQWTRSRNQQRNWETLMQIISLRTLPENISTPQRDQDSWSFEFDVPTPGSVANIAGPLGQLAEDCQDVPMIVGLDETAGSSPCLAPGSNVFFTVVDP
jgi:hypothetical protein